MKYYHVWFQTKLKKYLLVDIIDARIHDLFKQIADEKEIRLLASGSLPDHMHLLIGLESHQDLAWAIKQFKGISSRKIFQEFKLLKQDFRVNNFWARRYGSKEVQPEGIQTTNDLTPHRKRWGFSYFGGNPTINCGEYSTHFNVWFPQPYHQPSSSPSATIRLPAPQAAGISFINYILSQKKDLHII